MDTIDAIHVTTPVTGSTAHRRRSRLRRHAIVAACLAVFALPAHADPDAAAQVEIDHLLAFVAASPCIFVRNGADYPATQARDHLAGKLRFAKGRIATAEDFIRYLGTGSSMSGEPYKVRCGTTESTSALWLSTELTRYRATAQKP